MASTSTTSAAARAPLGSVSDNAKSNNKRSSSSTDSKPAATLSPYAQRMKELEGARATGSNKVFMYLKEDILECIPGKLEELDVDDIEELDEDAKQAAYDSLTQQQVDDYLQVMVVDRKLLEHQREGYNQIMFADPRNNQEDGMYMVMLNTYSSWCMYPVIYKMITAATTLVNKAKRAVADSPTTPNVAVEAFNKAFGTILAIDAMDHWKMDTESLEDCEKVAKKVGKLASDLLWFDDSELGFLLDSYSRKAMLSRLETINKEWSDIGGLKYKTKSNGQGLGRSQAAPAPPAKKQKTIVATTTTTSGTSNDNERLVSFLKAMSDKKKLREKTCVQLKIASVVDAAKKNAVVVLSGATDMKKMNQLCAYVTGNSQGFEYHSQRGTCIKGSRMELELEESRLWLAAKSLSKQAASAGAAHVEDKSVKIIQVFQGLVTSTTSGVVYDSNDARNVKAFFVLPNGERFEISLQAVIANKCLGGKPLPMPRLVKHDLNGYTPNVRTGFGKGLYVSNRALQADRQGPQYIFMAGTSSAQVKKTHDVCQSRPIANPDGTVTVDEWRGQHFSPQNVATAGPPTTASS